MANEETTVPAVISPHLECLASRETKCGAIDSAAKRPWVCLDDWRDGWRPVGADLVKVENNFNLPGPPVGDTFEARYTPPRHANFYVTFPAISERANNFAVIPVENDSPSKDDALVIVRNMFGVQGYASVYTAQEFPEIQERFGLTEIKP